MFTDVFGSHVSFIYLVATSIKSVLLSWHSLSASARGLSHFAFAILALDIFFSLYGL